MNISKDARWDSPFQKVSRAKVKVFLNDLKSLDTVSDKTSDIFDIHEEFEKNV